MSVKLVSITDIQIPNFMMEQMSPEELIVYIARVSNPSNQMNMESAPKLINYLIKHKHWSPFEFVDMTVQIVTRRSIAAQILRHKSFSFQEFCMSGESEIYFDLPNAVDKNKRQLYKLKLKDIYEKWQRKDAFGYSLRNRIKNMFIRVYDEKTKLLTHAHIKDVFQTGVKPIFEIELFNGKKIKCTKEHKVLSKNGFVSLEEGCGLKLIGNKAIIENKDFLIGTNGIKTYQSYDWLLSEKIDAINTKTGLEGISKNAGVSYHTIRKWLKIHGLTFTKKEVSQYKDPWNKGKFGYKTKPHSNETILKMKEKARKGKDSNLWRGGVQRNERVKIADWCSSIRYKKMVDSNFSCVNCGSNDKLELDHIKPVFSNPELAYDYNNIQVLCKQCHNEKHTLAGDRKIWRNKHKGNALTVEWSKIKSVNYLGEEMTYDLEIDHKSHNYVADGVIVHNSQRYSTATQIQPIKLRKQGKTNRQSSEEIIEDSNLDSLVKAHVEKGKELYDYLIKEGVSRETARDILPLSTETTMYMKGSVRSWIHYLELRCSPDTQLEHREIADDIKSIFNIHFPNIKEALGWSK